MKLDLLRLQIKYLNNSLQNSIASNLP